MLLQVANFLVGLTFLHLLNTLGTGLLYSFFTLICFSATLFVKQNVVETKGRTLEEIECMVQYLTHLAGQDNPHKSHIMILHQELFKSLRRTHEGDLLFGHL